MLNKRCITFLAVYRRPFTSKEVFWVILIEFEFAVHFSSQSGISKIATMIASQ